MDTTIIDTALESLAENAVYGNSAEFYDAAYDSAFDPTHDTTYNNTYDNTYDSTFNSSINNVTCTKAAVGIPVTANRVSFLAVMGLLTVLFTAVTLALGVALGGMSPDHTDWNMTEGSAISGSIIFTGGDYDIDSGLRNPMQAELSVEGAVGALTILQWWITTEDGAAVLFDSRDRTIADIGGALNQLCEIEAHGEYSLLIRFKDESGSIYRLGGNFSISEVVG